ncbi:MAG: hypothetical protein ABIL16_03985 [candidate division WOR-3 bacterium]
MRYLILGLYIFAFIWLILSGLNLYINWKRLKDLEREIEVKRVHIDVWKTEMELLKGKNVKDSIGTAGYNGKR